MESEEDYYYVDSPQEEDEEEEEETVMEVGGEKFYKKSKRGRGEEDEEEDDGFDMSQNMATKSNENSDEEEYPYEVLSPDEVVKHMNDSIEQVNIILQLPPTVTRLLLNHFKWDKDKLTERYYDDDQEKFFSDIRVVNPFRPLPPPSTLFNGLLPPSSSSPSSYATASSSQDSKFKKSSSKAVQQQQQPPPQQLSRQLSYECEICCEPATSTANSMTGLKCGHIFCANCWSRYLSTKIMDEGMGESIYCPAHGCEVLVDDERVMSLLTDPAVKVKYQHLITNSFVEYNKCLRWCTAPNCNYVIKVSHFEAKPVRCKCGHYFCFACGENWHDPVQCNWLKRWIKKCDDDSETSNWIAANTRECPKCRATIEKDGGCNHMLCKRCKFDFCWVCLGPWEPHGSSWYNCNRYDEDAAKKARDAQEKSRSALQRYLFYCNRYMNHMQSLKFENRLYISVGQKMEELQQHNMSWIEVQFLKKAVDILCQCRQTLMYTYVFAFYLKKNNQSIIFEDNQKDLEVATEQLSEYLERYITLEMLVDIKQKVQDKYRYCESRRKVLLDHVHEGYDKDLWLYQDINI